MRKRRSGVLAVAVVAALSCTGCVRTGEDAARHQARKLALEDAEQVAEEVERLQFPQGGGDPGTPGYRPAWTNAGMVERIASEYSGPNAGPSDGVLRRELISGQPWAGFLGAVEVVITREAETGGGLLYATGSATLCVRFEIHGNNGSRRVTTREIDCTPSVAAWYSSRRSLSGWSGWGEAGGQSRRSSSWRRPSQPHAAPAPQHPPPSRSHTLARPAINP
jgi:hypothetical protein